MSASKKRIERVENKSAILSQRTYRGFDKKAASRFKLCAELVIVLVFAINSSVVVYFQNRIDHFKDTRTFWSHAYQASLTLQNAFVTAKSASIANAEDYLKKAAAEASVGLLVHWNEFATEDKLFQREAATLSKAMNDVDSLESFNAFMAQLNRIEAAYIAGKSLPYNEFNLWARSLAVYVAAIIFVFASLARAFFQYAESRTKDENGVNPK